MKKLFINDQDTQTEELVENQEKTSVINNIILYNDEVNTFDFVIDSLIKVCKHDSLQAEQCTYLVHYAGKCAVKSGSFDELEPICETLLNMGLTAAIE